MLEEPSSAVKFRMSCLQRCGPGIPPGADKWPSPWRIRPGTSDVSCWLVFFFPPSGKRNRVSPFRGYWGCCFSQWSTALFNSIFRTHDICHDVNYLEVIFSLKELQKLFYFMMLLNQIPIYHCIEPKCSKLWWLTENIAGKNPPHSQCGFT